MLSWFGLLNWCEVIRVLRQDRDVRFIHFAFKGGSKAGFVLVFLVSVLADIGKRSWYSENAHPDYYWFVLFCFSVVSSWLD